MGQAGLRLPFVTPGIWTRSYARSAECDRTRRRGAARHGIPAIPRAPSRRNRAHRDCARRTPSRFNRRHGPRLHRRVQKTWIQIRYPRLGGISLRLNESTVDSRRVTAETRLKGVGGRRGVGSFPKILDAKSPFHFSDPPPAKAHPSPNPPPEPFAT